MTFRHWKAKLGHYLLLVAIVAVGVGAFNGIRQASRSASANFGLFNQAVSGRSDFLIESPTQRFGPEQLSNLGRLAFDPDWHLVPVIEGSVTSLDESGQPASQLRLIGLDLLALANLPTLLEDPIEFAEEESTWYEWLGSAQDVWIGRGAATKLGVEEGDSVSILASGRIMEISVRKVLEGEDSSLGDDLILGDLPTIQALLSRPGEVNRVEVVLRRTDLREDRSYLEQIRNRLSENLPSGMRLSPTENRAADRAAMTAAFRLNLTILSLIAILVGAYLILQALDAAVVRKRTEIATLRSLGVNGRIIFFICILEAGVIGVLGSLFGIGVGYLLALGSVGMLTDTVNALYFATSIEALSLTWTDCFVGLGIGVFFSLLAGWLPARDAMSTPPAQVLSKGDWSPGFDWLRNPKTGILLLLFGALALLPPPFMMEGGSKMPVGGFLAAGAWILGAALLSGQMLVLLAGWLRPLCQGPVFRLACSRLRDGSSRHRLAVAGLVVAVGMVTGMFQMVDSFRGTIREWFDVRFQAELYISERGVTGAGNINGIDPLLMDELLEDPAIEYGDVMYLCRARPKVGITLLAGVDMDAWSSRIRQIWLKQPGSLTPVEGSEPALVSETFARRFEVLEGGTVELDTPNGKKLISPIGIFTDYGNEFGTAAVSIDSWKKWTGSDRPINVSLYLKEGVQTNETRDRLRLAFPGLEVRNAKELREVALGIFEQTFQATTALNAIGLCVAFAGLLLGLLSIFDESTRTWTTLRHLGFSNRQFILSAGLEGAGIALAALVCGALAGLAMGWLLIFVINVQSFGWTLLWQIPVLDFLRFGVLLILIGFASGCVSAFYWNLKNR
jgi:putative ABC transport system permease protein